MLNYEHMNFPAWKILIPKIHHGEEYGLQTFINSYERIVSERATASFCSTWQAGSFGALNLLDLLVLSRDVLCIDLFCFLYNVKCKIHVFITDLQVLQGF